MGLRPSLRADIALLGAAAIWGASFVVVKRALADASPLAFMAVRFVVGAAVLGAIFRRRISVTDPGQIRGGAVLALFIGGGFAAQTIGLLHTTPARSAFITGFYVVGVPLIAAALGMRGLNRAGIAGAALAFSGLWLMTGPLDGTGPAEGAAYGEALTLACAALFAAHIVGVDILTRRHDARALAFWQVAITAAASVPLALLAESPRLDPTPRLLGALLVTGVGATALTLAIQNTVQSRTTPARAAIIFTTEPIFAALTSYLVEGELLTGRAAVGAGLILSGMLVSELPQQRAARGTA